MPVKNAKNYDEIINLIQESEYGVLNVNAKGEICNQTWYSKAKTFLMFLLGKGQESKINNEIKVGEVLVEFYKEKNSNKGQGNFEINKLLKPYINALDTIKFIVNVVDIYSREKIKVKNRTYKFIHNESAYREIESREITHIPETCYVLTAHHGNLGHFFHDNFIQFYIMWRLNKKKVLVSIKTSSMAASQLGNDDAMIDFLKCVIGSEFLIMAEYDKIYSFPNLIIPPEGRDLKIYKNYLDVCKEIKFKCFNSFNPAIKENRKKRILYGRSELERKNLLDVDEAFLKENDIGQINLSQYSFYEQLQILSTTQVFIYVVGAGVFNLLFLDNSVKVLEINPFKNNSWAQMFGMDKLCQFETYVSINIKLCDTPVQGEPELDSHIYFDQDMKQKIQSLLE
ncbi:MAG: glycosyltransferase family 61 protein [Candidatus Marinimicrobia bacterium]|jgi:hypothetical protein|nr:glycosyltransferase family 61 protein [bacterium]MBT7900498.1 glycosyltransferase family 61 protein [Candidatus Neomarinimicrobiota bacterium]